MHVVVIIIDENTKQRVAHQIRRRIIKVKTITLSRCRIGSLQGSFTFMKTMSLQKQRNFTIISNGKCRCFSHKTPSLPKNNMKSNVLRFYFLFKECNLKHNKKSLSFEIFHGSIFVAYND